MGATEDPRLGWAAHLFQEWEWFNRNYLKRALRTPVFAIAEHASQLGSWDLATRTLSISARHIERDSWAAVVETLRHEMAHQYAHEVLGATSEPPHGPAFQRGCRALRVSPRATGDGAENSDDPVTRARQRVLARVEKLLALSESPNTHEAELAIAHARRLLLEHNLSELDLETRSFAFRQIGRATLRKHLYEALLANVLGEFFFVKAIWVWTYDAARDKDGKLLQIHGTPTNLDLAEYVHGFVLGLLEPLWRRHKQAQGIASDRCRLQFFAGVVEGFEATLRRQNVELEAKALVWKGDPELDAHYRWINPSIQTSSYGGGERGRAYADGVAEGERVRLRKPLQSGTTRVGGLLGPGR